MKKQNKEEAINPLADTPLPSIVKAVTVIKTNYLSCVAYELTIIDGQILEAKPISEAPDVMAITAGHCSRKLWEFSKDQKSKDYK